MNYIPYQFGSNLQEHVIWQWSHIHQWAEPGVCGCPNFLGNCSSPF